METTAAFAGFACANCVAADATTEATADDLLGVGDLTAEDRCSECNGVLSIQYDRADPVTTANFADEYTDQRRYAPFLPFDPASMVALPAGGTPLVSCPTLAADFGVDRVLVKDEGRNPTGTAADRGMALAVTAARQRERDTVSLPTTGHGGQSAAAYAGRAGLASHAFVPTRSPYVTKAMINVHGGEMHVVEGRYPDAVDAYEAWLGTEADGEAGDVASVGPASPFRREGAKLATLEVLAQCGWKCPDAIVQPTGHGIGLAGAHAAITDSLAAGLIDSVPRLVAAQPDGCGPIVDAVDGDGHPTAWDRPDTIAGTLEIADPVRSAEAVRAVDETDGEAVAVPDDQLLEAAVHATKSTGIEIGATGGVGVAAASTLANRLDEDFTVVVLNPVAGDKESDVLRSELMSRGE